jgi:DNA modification methylase
MSKSQLWTADTAKNWIDEHLESAKKKYSQSNLPQQISFRKLCADWDWAQRSDVYTHSIHSYPAKLLAYIPIAFLTSSLSSEADNILDPFAGTGTVLLESLVHKYHPLNSLGVELNPIARLIAKVKTTPLNVEEVEIFVKKLGKIIRATENPTIPDFQNRDFWFRKSAQRQLASIRCGIENLNAPPSIKDFFWVCFSAIIRDMSRADPFIAPPVLFNALKFKGDRRSEINEIVRKKNRYNALTLFNKKVSNNIERMRTLTKAIGVTNKIRSKIIWDDVRDIKQGICDTLGHINKTNSKSLDNSIDLIISSPPYIAAQKYIRTTKLELSWLGLATDSQIKKLDRQLIGSEKIDAGNLKELKEVKNATADKLLEKVYAISPLRAQIASNYYNNMRDAINSMHKVLRPKARCILVVGNNTVSGIPAMNHLILSDIANEKRKFSTELILRDNIRSHGMITKRHETSGMIDDEYILVMRKNS